MVPTDLIVKIGKLHRGGTFKAINNIHKHKLVYHENKIYDGYRLTYLGYDFLCLKAMSMRNEVVSVGTRIGVGKESDIYACAGPNDEAYVLKLARLGRISFRNIKNKRDYLLKRKAASWLYMSRLAAFREYTYMQVLHEHGLPIPVPRDWSRHGVLMDRVDGFNLASVNECADPEKMYIELMELILKLASFGLIHADFNEFNLMCDDVGKITLIDFPQMVSISHENAQWYFERDVTCIIVFFKKRFHFECDFTARWEDVKPGEVRLDRLVKASGVNSGVGMPGDESDHESEELPEERELEDEADNDDNITTTPNDDEMENAEDLIIPVDEEDVDEEREEVVEGEEKKAKPPRKVKVGVSEEDIRAQVRKELRKKTNVKQSKSAKRQGKRTKQRAGARTVKESLGGSSGGW